MECIVAFGPHQTYLVYFLGANAEISKPDHFDPEFVRRVYGDKKAEFPYYVALGPEKSWIMGYYRDREDLKNDSVGFEGKYPKLAEWTRKDRHHLKSTKIALGPNGSFWACSNAGYRWHALPDDLEHALQKSLSPSGWTRKPIHVALGLEGAWVLLYEDGRLDWSQKAGLYEVLWDILVKTKEGDVVYVSLSAFDKGVFFVLFSDGSAKWCVPNTWSKAIQRAADEHFIRFSSSTDLQPDSKNFNSSREIDSTLSYGGTNAPQPRKWDLKVSIRDSG